MNNLVVPNSVLLAKVAQAIAQGNAVLIPVKGRSMHPFVIGDKECVELYPITDIRIGDVVLATLSSGKYLLHRIYGFKGEDGVILMGDGNVRNKEFCLRSDILAKARFVVKEDGRRLSFDSFSMRLAFWIWKFSLPVRGVLLKLYRLLVLK